MESASLTLPALLANLQGAITNDTHQIQTATTQLSQWQNQPNFLRLLQDCLGDRSLPFEARWLAAIQMKNVIDRFWRKTARNAISLEEKRFVRSRCIEIGISETDDRLKLQNALFVARIARIDYPQDWPEAVQNVLRKTEELMVSESLQPQLSASLLLLLSLVKELSTARLMGIRRSFYVEGPAILKTVSKVYHKSFGSWQEATGVDLFNMSLLNARMKCSLLCLRILRRALVGAFEHPVRHECVHETWKTLSQHFEQMINVVYHKAAILFEEKRLIIEKMILQLSKLHVSMIDIHPTSFPQLPNAILIARVHWDALMEFGRTFGVQSLEAESPSTAFEEDDKTQSFEEVLGLKGLMLLRGCVKMVYSPAPTLKFQTSEDKQDKAISKQAMKDTILSEDLVRQMMEIIVTKFFVFRTMDLQRWAQDPFEWERNEEGQSDAWKYSVRLCSEKLFLDLVLNHKQLLIEPLLAVFASIAGKKITNKVSYTRCLHLTDLENKNVLLKDSIYSAVGLSAPALTGKLDFNGFLNTVLLPELQSPEIGYNILRRRAAILIAQWSTVGNLDANMAYQVFLHLLDKSQDLNDIVVRLTAGRQLKRVVDSYETNIYALQPYASQLLRQLMSLVIEAEPAETKIALIGTVQSFVQVMEEVICPCADEIVSKLPLVWEQADGDYLLKQVVIGLLSELLKAMKAESSRFHNLILPLISSALDDGNEARSYLLDDTIDLWASLLAQVWQAVTRSMEQGLRRDARVLVCELAERLLVVAQRLGGLDLFRKVALAKEAYGFMSAILDGLLCAFRSHQDPSPKAPKTDINGVVETHYWRIFARILVTDFSALFQLIQRRISETGSLSSEQILGDLLTELFSHYDYLCSPTATKLVALAIAALFVTEDAGIENYVASRLQEIITVWVAAIHECSYEGRDTLIWDDMDKLKPDGVESPEQGRRRELEMGDPIRCENIRNVVAKAMQRFSARSPNSFRESLENVDTDIMAQFKELELF